MGPEGPQGPMGEQGPPGPVGPAGADGTIIHAGSGAPQSDIGSPGDFYLDISAGQLYGPKTENEWDEPLELAGSEGPQGPPGEDGEDGQDGEDGSQIYAGEGAPDDNLGQKGDYYLDKANYDLYGPKTGDGWSDPINLQGPQGEQGPQGPKGPAGTTDHGGLDGLQDDDHLQYLLVDGVREATDGFAVTGTFDSGTVPIEGSGTRLMWYPGKAAFRAGRVSGTIWDDANIGDYSVGLGGNTEASGNFSVAMGNGDATANYSVAMGNNSTASGKYSTAMGFATDATGETSTSFGRNTVAQAEGSFVIGKYNTIAGDTDDWISTDPLFVAGNGSSPAIRSNALTLHKNGNMTIAGTLTQNSDRRLKKDIKPLESDILEKIKKIQTVRYRFREGTGHPSDEQLGLIAQEVQAQFPELVTTANDGYLSLSYSKLSAVLLKGVQEQQNQIETLKSENERIKQRLTRLEQRTGVRAGPFSSAGWSFTAIVLVLAVVGFVILYRQKFPFQYFKNGI
ncbi:MAG: hypothetical protein GVY20_07070 [Bacteroidetes bacterium]|nr:hypothetical protein [Bacteroidota bacterium]